MTKHAGKYYLQYACPGAEFNVYADGVYVADAPLGPFHLAENNPFSYKPGGFLPGAGHGSTMQDRRGQWWHTATMRISKNHVFERRVGIWPALYYRRYRKGSMGRSEVVSAQLPGEGDFLRV